jgi:leucyl aminopeptidase
MDKRQSEEGVNMLTISFAGSQPSQGAIALGVFKNNVFSTTGQSLDGQMQGALSRGLKASYFKGNAKETLSFLACGPFERVVLLGLGEPNTLTEAQAYDVGGSLVGHLLGTPHTHLTVRAEDLTDDVVRGIAFGAALRGWQFHKYRTKLEDAQKMALREVTFCVKNPEEATRAFQEYHALAESVLWARELIAEPANVLYPETYVARIKELEAFGLTVEALTVPEMEKLGMGALLGVGQGSIRDSYLGIVQWHGGKPGEAPVALVGKGVTFDTGGISIKPSGGMEEMKADMAGSAAVLAVLRTLALRKAPVNAVAVVALVENMPSGTAQRPGDVVTSMSGQTIEVLNTDAEGRLILADALYYTHQRFKPRFMVDVATLTGAMKVALADEYAGLFSPEDGLAKDLEKAGQSVGERVWRLPMGAGYDSSIDCAIADVKNITSPGYGAGSITAAQFLGRFVGDTPWAHLDIANMDMSTKDRPLAPKGPTGFGVCLLNRWIKQLES